MHSEVNAAQGIFSRLLQVMAWNIIVIRNCQNVKEHPWIVLSVLKNFEQGIKHTANVIQMSARGITSFAKWVTRGVILGGTTPSAEESSLKDRSTLRSLIIFWKHIAYF